MEITNNLFKEKKSQKTSLSHLALLQLSCNEREESKKGKTERTALIALKNMVFTETLVDILYKKGVLKNKDIKEIALQIGHINPKNITRIA